jgi:hypothetical protein
MHNQQISTTTMLKKWLAQHKHNQKTPNSNPNQKQKPNNNHSPTQTPKKGTTTTK